MSEPILRSFQASAYSKWSANGFRGVIKAVPGAGKTMAALEVIKGYAVSQPKSNQSVLIVAPTRPLVKQWTGILEHEGITATVMTINKARKLPPHTVVGLLVVDEVHRTTSDVNRRLYSVVEPHAILGLSATPSKDSVAYAGPVFLNVDFGQALDEDMIAEFTVYFHPVSMTLDEHFQYKKMTHLIGQAYHEPVPGWFNAHLPDRIRRIKYAQYLALQRRAIVYGMSNREPYAVGIVKGLQTAGKKVLVFCQRIDKAEALAAKLECGVYHSKSKGDASVQAFKSNASRALVTVRSLTEGFDVPDIDAVVIVSTAITEAYHIQSMGRAIRKYGDKLKEIHIMLGVGTTDEKLLAYAKRYKSEVVGGMKAFKHTEAEPGPAKPKNRALEAFGGG